jgi:hypothetical protein
MRRCEKSVSFFGYVKERSYPKGYNRRYVLLKGARNRYVLLLTDIFYCYYIRIYCRRRVPLPLCFSIIPLSFARTTRMDVNARGSISLSVHGTLASKKGQERTREEQSWTFTPRHRIPRRRHRTRLHPRNHRTCRHQYR